MPSKLNFMFYMILATIITAIAVLAISSIFLLMSWSNAEKRQRNLIAAKQADNNSEFDNLKKKINTVVSVPEKKFESLRSIIVDHAEARNSQNEKAVMQWVQESVPDIASAGDIYDKLMNIVVASRDSWTRRQKELLDMKRVHDNILDIGFRGLFLSSILRREKINVTIVTSSQAQQAFEEGVDEDDGRLFK